MMLENDMKRFYFFIAALLLGAAALVGCQGQQSALPQTPESAAPKETASPAPTPTPIDLEQVEEEVSGLWNAALSMREYVPEGLLEGGESRFLAGDDESRAWLPECQKAVEGQLRAALEQLKADAEEQWGAAVETELTAPNWQMIYTALMTEGSVEGCEAVLQQLTTPTVEASAQDGVLKVTVTVGPYDYKEAARLMSEEMSAKFLYSYVLTVYDEAGREVDYTARQETGNLALGIVWPLESYTNLRKTWYAARDKGARKHTGTDIWAAEGTEIYSCTDGTVLFVGSDRRMGNAVIIEDQYGYEYHYYHMVRLTDFLQPGDQVEAGQLIGHVGNTGNSVRNHLHLTIVAPDGYFVDPYPYLEAIAP